MFGELGSAGAVLAAGLLALASLWPGSIALSARRDRSFARMDSVLPDLLRDRVVWEEAGGFADAADRLSRTLESISSRSASHWEMLSFKKGKAFCVSDMADALVVEKTGRFGGYR